jgi:hypothetical protein
MHYPARKTDFLLGLAQGGIHGRRVAGVLLAPRKGDLPGVMFQPGRPFRQNQLRLCPRKINRNQHTRRP